MNPRLKVSCKLIGICGHAGSGKDTVGSYLHQKHDLTWKLAFADGLKEAAAKMFDIGIDWFHDPDFKEVPHPNWSVTPRQIAQFFGTEMVRDTLGKLLADVAADFWIYRMANLLNGLGASVAYDADDVVAITDVRFQNEYDWIIANGGIIIHLTRPGADGTVGIPSHQSEAGFRFTTPDQTYLLVNEGTLEELYEKVDLIIQHANIYPLSNPDSF